MQTCGAQNLKAQQQQVNNYPLQWAVRVPTTITYTFVHPLVHLMSTYLPLCSFALSSAERLSPSL